jgi:hypothetical protein
MNDRLAGVPRVVRLSLGAAFLGVLLCLPLVIKETPWTFVICMFLSQPLLGAAFLLFAWQVFRDLRNKELL